MNHFEILGLTWSATESDAKKAYHKLAMVHHPDKGGNPKKFTIIKEAYDKVIKDIKNGTRTSSSAYDTSKFYSKSATARPYYKHNPFVINEDEWSQMHHQTDEELNRKNEESVKAAMMRMQWKLDQEAERLRKLREMGEILRGNKTR